MKTTLFLLIFSIFSSSCAYLHSSKESNHHKTVASSKPTHKGSYETGKWKAWSYRAYANSVRLQANIRTEAGIMRSYEIDVFDINPVDSQFDTVITHLDGRTEWGSTREYRNLFKKDSPNLSHRATLEFISIATDIKRSINQRKARERYKKELLKELKEELLREEGSRTPNSSLWNRTYER